MSPERAHHEVAEAAEVVDLAARRAARVLCAICRHWVRPERRWRDAEDRVWDVCTDCGTAATTAARREAAPEIR